MREPMILRQARINADAIRRMGWDAIAEAHRLGVPAHYMATELGDGIVREDPDGSRHLMRKVDGEWTEVAAFPPRPDWRAPG